MILEMVGKAAGIVMIVSLQEAPYRVPRKLTRIRARKIDMPFSQLFPDNDYQFQMRPRPSEPAAFFGPSAESGVILAERRRWLREAPDVYSAHRSEGDALLDETIRLARQWGSLPAGEEETLDAQVAPAEKCRLLGEFWEPDFLLLRPDLDGHFRLVSGCVCFPSSWALSEKIGKSLEQIHDAVPGLNEAAGKAIHTFLTRMKPGTGWMRENWGLSASDERNQHPARNLPKLSATSAPESVLLRVEEQILCSLPETGGVLFGIRLRHHSLGEVWDQPEWHDRIERALRTMPEAMARYKNLADWRKRFGDLKAGD